MTINMSDYFLILGLLLPLQLAADALQRVEEKVWIHGAEDCQHNTDPAIDVLQADASSYILRQNRCVNFEAPFIYVLFGEHSVFIQDTGATADAADFPLYRTIQELIATHRKATNKGPLKMLVTHSHSHGDHTAADAQFRHQPGVTLVEADAESLRTYFKFSDWPAGRADIELGGRTLVVFPIPGHQAESIAVYDPQTRWLLSGDSFYPGRLYVRNWQAYKASINRMLAFTESHEVRAIMGTHIEMSAEAGKDYPMGNTYQPDEAPLPLTPDDLARLKNALDELGGKATEKSMERFIISPVGTVQKVIGGTLGWIKKLLD